ncbi:MAG: hypothetical protein AB2L11_02455 [Syntrophobacteraceae bacterium]
MKGIIYCLVLFVVLGAFTGCATKREESRVGSAAPMRVDKRIKVADVANKTQELFDVDAIGMLWNGLNQSLMQKGLLYMGEPSIPVLRLEASIVKYQKGHFLLRPVIPYFGKTLLSVKCELKDGDRVIGSVESEHTISMGKIEFTNRAWKKIFSEVAEDVVSQLAAKI